MTTSPLGSLVAKLAIETAAFHRDLGRAATALNSNTAKMKKSLEGIHRESERLNRSFRDLRATATTAFAALGAGIVIRNIIQVAAEFQRLGASLKTVTGSAHDAAVAFDQIKRFAATTPFDLQQVTSAFIKLKALGLDPSMEALESYGNTASAMGKQLNDFIEAVADAATGEFERLKEFGIRASSQGDQVAFTFQNVTTVVRKNATEIEQYLRQIGDTTFAGAMVEQMNTLGGALSNLGDSMSVFQNEVAEGGLGQAIADIARGLADSAAGSQNLARNFGAVLGVAARGVGDALMFVMRNARELMTILGGLIALKAAAMFAGLAVAVVKFGVALTKAARAGVLVDLLLSKSILGVLAKLLVTLGGATVMWETFGKEAVEAINAVEGGLVSFEAAVTNTGDATEDTTSKFEEFLRELTHHRDQQRGLAAAYQLGAAAVDRANTAIEIHNFELKSGINLTDEQRRVLSELIDETRKYERQIDATIEAEQEAARVAAERQAQYEAQLEEMRHQQEEARRLMLQPFLNAIDGIQAAFTDAFEQIFSGGVKSFDDLAQAVKRIMIRLAAEVATLLVFRPVLAQTLGSLGVPGITGASGAGGGGGLLGNIPSPFSFFNGGSLTSGINSFGSSLGFAATPGGFSAPGAFAAGAAGPPASMGGFFGSGATLTGTLGAAGLGAFAGGIIANFMGRNEVGGSIGGGLGAGIGFAVGGPIGAAIGGLGGSVLGSLLGGKKKTSVGPNAAARIGGGPNGFFIGGTGADNGGQLGPVVAEAQRTVDILTELVRQFNLTAAPVASVLRGRNFIGSGTAANRGFGSAEGLITAYLQRGGLTGDNENLNKVLRGSTATTLADNITMLSSIPGLLGPALSEFELAIRAVNDNFDKITDKAEEFGIATDLIAKARERELKAVREQYRAPFLQAGAGIVDFLNGQSLAGDSSLSPVERLTEAQRQFGDLLRRVRGGEVGLSSQLTQSASTVLGFGRQQFASTVDFANLERFVRGNLVEVADLVSSDDFFDEAMRQQTQVLVEAEDQTTDAVKELQREVRLLREALLAS